MKDIDTEITVKVRHPEDRQDIPDLLRGMTIIGSQHCETHGTASLIGFTTKSSRDGLYLPCAIEKVEDMHHTLKNLQHDILSHHGSDETPTDQVKH